MMFATNPKNRNKMIWGAVVAVLLIAVGIWLLQDKKAKDNKTEADNSQTTLNNNYTLGESEGMDETPAEDAAPAPASPKKLTYNEALKIYGTAGNNFRIQFSTNCLSTPGRLALANGAKFMIDNRDTVAHTFTLGKQTFKVSKYGFVIVTATEKGTLALKCDGNTRSDIVVQ